MFKNLSKIERGWILGLIWVMAVLWSGTTMHFTNKFIDNRLEHAHATHDHPHKHKAHTHDHTHPHHKHSIKVPAHTHKFEAGKIGGVKR